jgi:hypothetical protein
MKLHLLFLGLSASIVMASEVVHAQVQGGAPTMGTCLSCGKAPKETRAQKREKSAACTAAAKQKGLKDKDRTTYLKACNNTAYSSPFAPPDWPLK